ncbi:autophagy-related 10 [Anticarsia gemmatalis]|uniref:autophagy-related 10 n=1 Tax=Anticarsia gemmatalis TaxID=129554 RepID=UPI003F768B68
MSSITFEEYLEAAKIFVAKSNWLCDGWSLKQHKDDMQMTYITKQSFIQHNEDKKSVLLKIEYNIFYHLSYGVPAFSFNVWNASGALLSLEDIRKMSFVQINQKDFYSVITQQEHPIFQRPYFMVHPCHTEELLAMFKKDSRNIIVTFLSLITPIVKFNLPMEYGL